MHWSGCHADDDFEGCPEGWRCEDWWCECGREDDLQKGGLARFAVGILQQPERV